MKNKSEVFNKCTTNECGLSIGTLRSDNGGEYLSKEFVSYLQSRGIHHELTAPYSPSRCGKDQSNLNGVCTCNDGPSRPTRTLLGRGSGYCCLPEESNTYKSLEGEEDTL